MCAVIARHLVLVLAAAVLTIVQPSPAGAEDGLIGIWLTEDRDSKIEFTMCGDVLCGRVVWLLNPHDENGLPFKDIRNPDPALRDRTILGLAIFQGVVPGTDARRWRGRVYNPEDGDTYKTFLSLLPNGTLEVKGCVLGGLICDKSYWTRSEL